MGDPALRDELRKEAERIIEDSNFTARSHLLAGREWASFSMKLGLPTEILAAILAGGAGVTAIVGTETFWTALLAFVSAALGAARAFLKPDEKAEAYTIKGTRFISIRNQARIFKNITLNLGKLDDELSARLVELRQQYDDLLPTAPTVIHDRQYKEARRGIETGEMDYVVDRAVGEGR